MVARRKLLITGGAALLVARRPSLAQIAGKIRRVGSFGISSRAIGRPVEESFMQGMSELGWVEGTTVEYRSVYAGGDVTQLNRLAHELVSHQPEVILVASPLGVRAVQQATKTIPIVMGNVSNAVGNGFIASLAKPGGNITGITSKYQDILGKLISIFHEVTPSAKRMAVLINETHPSHGAFWEAAQSACAALDLNPTRIVANAPRQLESAVKEIVQQQLQAVVVVADPMYWTFRAQLQELLMDARLPAAYQMSAHTHAGGLLSYSSNLKANYRHAAKFVDKILKGARASDLPVEQPIVFELVVNTKTAETLGITLPQTVLLSANDVIQ